MKSTVKNNPHAKSDMQDQSAATYQQAYRPSFMAFLSSRIPGIDTGKQFGEFQVCHSVAINLAHSGTNEFDPSKTVMLIAQLTVIDSPVSIRKSQRHKHPLFASLSTTLNRAQIVNLAWLAHSISLARFARFSTNEVYP